MARGVTTDAQTLYNVMCSYYDTRSFAATARELNMPETTVKDLYNAHKEDKQFVELRLKKEAEFVEKANHLIFKAMNRLNKELDSEDNIPVNQLTTAIGTLYDKKAMAQTGVVGNVTPNVQIVMVDNSKLEGAMYEEN